MERIKQCTEALVEAIQESEAYQNYMAAKQKVEKSPELNKKVTEFRRKNYEIQNRRDGADLYKEMERFEVEYHEIRKDPVIRDLLQYELELCRMMQRINLNLVQAVDLGITEFQDIIK